MSAKHKSLGKNYRARKPRGPQNLKEANNPELINKHDYFPTYHSCTRRLLDAWQPRTYSKDKINILEPCAGAGDITKVLHEYGYKKRPRALIERLDDDSFVANCIKTIQA